MLKSLVSDMVGSEADLQLAVKCQPDQKVFERIESAGIDAVELHTNAECLRKGDIVSICGDFPFSYAVHAPNDIVAPERTFELAQAVGARLVVTHDMYWEDEWPLVVKAAQDARIPLAIENVDGLFTFTKVLLRYEVKRCLDFEHAVFQMQGFYPDGLKIVLPETIHVHLTGYNHGNLKYHTHFYESPDFASDVLNFLDNGYEGMVVSEASIEYQTEEHFQKLKDFFDEWESGRASCRSPSQTHSVEVD